jgi:hypothetical protein
MQATASPDFVTTHELNVHVDTLMKTKTVDQARDLYGNYFKDQSPAQRTLSKMVSSSFLNANCQEPLAMNAKLQKSFVKMQSFARMSLAVWLAEGLRHEKREREKCRFCQPCQPSGGGDKPGCSPDTCLIS